MQAKPALVLTHISVIDATGALLKADSTVVMRGDRIAAIGKNGEIRISKDPRVVDSRAPVLR